MMILFLAALVIDPLSLFLFGNSSVLINMISFPILTIPAAGFFIVGLYFVAKSHNKVLVEDARKAKFIDSGVYSLVRHPMYLGTLLLLLSFFFISASLVALGIWITFFIILDKMATYEENDLKKLLGKKYVDYQNKVPKWFPRL